MSTTEYPLPGDDIGFLNVDCYKWKQVVEGSKRGLIIQGYVLPDGYIPSVSDLMLIIPPDYPMGKIDMFYFCPSIARKNGVAIEALADELHFGKQWQRWSRHYEWRPSIDSISTHVTYVRNQLECELKNG